MQNSATGQMRNRMRIVLCLFLVFGFLVILGRLFKLQLVEGEKLQQRAVEQQTRSTILGAERGTIYDRNGNVLARSASVWNVCVSPAEMDEKRVDEVATELSRILEVDKAFILEEAKDKSSYYKRIKRRVDRTIVDEILEYTTENKIEGVFFEEDTKRYYTYGNLASTVLGFTNDDNQGAYGLEAYYNKTLSGTSGMVVSAKNALGSDMPFKYQQQYAAQDGNSMVLTLDESIQHFLERNLETAVVEHSINNRAAGIVMNVKTGEILAMASKPDFDPNDPYTLVDPAHIAELATYVEGTEEYRDKRTDLWYAQWRNKAISDPYEPGSVFKLVTAATALDNGVVSLTDHFYCDGSHNVSGVDISCWKVEGHGGQNFIEAIQNSCNPAFIMIGQRVGGNMMYNYMRNFGLDEKTGIDLPGEADSIMISYDLITKPGMVELSSTSFGQSNKLTVVQMISAASATINGGKLMQPYIVKQIVDSEGNVIETTQPTVKRQVISEETSATMRMLAEKVVEQGSGSKAAIPGYRIGGKTGTSQKLDDLARGVHILSFVGFAPMEDPEIAILVILDEPQLTNAYGSTIAAPVVGAIMQETLQYLNISPQYTEAELLEREVQVPDLVYKKPHDAQADLTALGLKTRIVGNGGEVLRQIPQPRSKIARGGTIILYTDEADLRDDIAVPDLVGMGAQEANRTIVNLGLNVELRGITTDGAVTVVGEQWPLAGEQASTGDVVIITLVEKPEEELDVDVNALLEMLGE